MPTGLITYSNYNAYNLHNTQLLHFTVDYSKSDHEFSPESDMEHGEPVEPLRRARTLEEGKNIILLFTHIHKILCLAHI